MLDKKEIKNIINFFYDSNYGTFTEILDNKNYTLAFSDCIKDADFNHIIHYSGDVNKIIQESSEKFLQRDRTSTIYITPLSDLYEKETSFKGLNKYATDCWMTLKKEDLKLKNINKNIRIAKIDINKENIYLDTFKKSFSNPDDVYGTLPDNYLIAEKRFFKNKNGFISNIFIAYNENNIPVGVVRSVIKNNLCFIYALAVEKKYRKNGFIAATLGKTVIDSAFNSDANLIIIQTEEGSSLEKLYSKIGFKTIFTGTYYKKNI